MSYHTADASSDQWNSSYVPPGKEVSGPHGEQCKKINLICPHSYSEYKQLTFVQDASKKKNATICNSFYLNHSNLFLTLETEVVDNQIWVDSFLIEIKLNRN